MSQAEGGVELVFLSYATWRDNDYAVWVTVLTIIAIAAWHVVTKVGDRSTYRRWVEGLDQVRVSNSTVGAGELKGALLRFVLPFRACFFQSDLDSRLSAPDPDLSISVKCCYVLSSVVGRRWLVGALKTL
jgi:hypothetical protein